MVEEGNKDSARENAQQKFFAEHFNKYYLSLICFHLNSRKNAKFKSSLEKHHRNPKNS
jgi:hypothetical protein